MKPDTSRLFCTGTCRPDILLRLESDTCYLSFETWLLAPFIRKPVTPRLFYIEACEPGISTGSKFDT